MVIPRRFWFVAPGRTLRVSLTGTRCALKCAHCGGVYLTGMRSLNEALAGAGGRHAPGCGAPGPGVPGGDAPGEGRPTCLVSGGCDAVGRVPVREHARDLRLLAERLRINLHVGIPDEEDAAVARDVAEVVSLDWVTEDATIDEVYGSGRGGADYERALVRLLDAGCVVVPHMCVGLRGGRTSGELRALDRLAALMRARPERGGGRVAALTFLVLVPTKGTRFQDVSPPPVEHVSGVVEVAHRLFPNLPLMVGCMRPSGAYREELDLALLAAGASVFVNPARSLRAAVARVSGGTASVGVSGHCCSFLASEGELGYPGPGGAVPG